MDDIRLAVRFPDEAARAVAARLRGATVEPIEACGAVVVVGVDLATERLLASGTSVLLVADPCPPRDTIEAYVRIARDAGGQLAVVNPDRFLPSRQLLRKQIPAVLGEPGLIRSHRWEPPSATDPTALPEPLLRDLDVMLWLMGRRPDRVYAVEQKDDGGGRYLQLHLGFPGGGMALLDHDGRLPPGDGYQSLSVIAASGAAYADDHANTQLAFRSGRPQAVRTEERAGQLAAVVQDFVDALRAGRDLATESAAGWRAVFAVADAAGRSLAAGRVAAVEGT